MTIEKRQSRLAENGEDLDRALQRLLFWAGKVRKLREQRKRLLYPHGKPSGKVRRMSLDEIRERAAAGGDEFNDEIPS